MRNAIAIVAMFFLAATVCAQDTPHNEFITLGTGAGPNVRANRSQPANALIVNDDVYMVDAGDGAVVQLVKAGLAVLEVDGLFISHQHFDHIGGVLAVIGLRAHLQSRNTLTIYGPPGTQTLIDGLVAGMGPSMAAATGMPGASWRALVEVQEVEHGSTIELDGVTVHIAENSHFAIPEESGLSEKAKSLAYRFDLEDRSIVYTGDTGPSEAVEELARGADILVSEMMDVDEVMHELRADPNMPPSTFAGIEWHLRAHHLTPRQVGEMASNAGVGKVVVTHMSPDINTDALERHYLGGIAETYDGEVVIADDLDRF